MLHCNMSSALSLQWGLDDLLADLRYSRRRGDLGRMALVAYCEVRRWARDAGNLPLAEHASELITASPHVSREAFIEQIDNLIQELEQAQSSLSHTPALTEARGPEQSRGHDAVGN
jgi:hypothetical protein